MGVYIEGMEMPTDCATLLKIFPDGRVGVPVHLNWMGTMVVNDAEAIPVPPHGRLGDLDKLENGLRHMAKYQHGERQQGILGCCETIRLAPTIIPASEERT